MFLILKTATFIRSAIKEILVLGLLLLMFANKPVYGCDICGCSSNGNYFGILPKFTKHFVGYSWANRPYTTVHPAVFREKESQSEEVFDTHQLTGRFVLNKRFQLFAKLPYNAFVQKEEGKSVYSSGLGDSQILSSMVVFHTPDSSLKKYRQNLIFVGGAKLPTGRYDVDFEHTDLYVPNLQVGSGSIDGLVGLNYSIRQKKLGLLAETIFKVNGKNKLDYKFGNRLDAALTLFWWEGSIRLQGAIIPKLGVRYNYAQKDYEKLSYNQVNDLSGGQQLFATAGVDVYAYRFGFLATIAKPLYQNFADGLINSGTQINIGVRYFLTRD